MKELQEGIELSLTEDYVGYGGLALFYSLLVRRRHGVRHFYITVRMGKECACERADDRLEEAMRAYTRIVSGAVTPCTLCDVMEDLRHAAKKCGKALYNRRIL